MRPGVGHCACLLLCASCVICEAQHIRLSGTTQSLQMKALCEVPRNGLQLLPYYARVTATLSRVFPDIGQGETMAATPAFVTVTQRPAAGRASCIKSAAPGLKWLDFTAWFC
jgi:hypothetical protein